MPASTTFNSIVSVSQGNAAQSNQITANLGTLAAGGSAMLVFTVAVAANSANGTIITNSATATSTTPDPIAANNTGKDTATVATQADLSVTKVDSPDPVFAGQNITYNITLTNNGPSNAQSVKLTDAVPTNTTFVSFAAPAGWVNATPGVGGTGTITSTLATLAVAHLRPQPSLSSSA